MRFLFSTSVTLLAFGNLEIETQEDGEPSPDAGMYLMSQETPHHHQYLFLFSNINQNEAGAMLLSYSRQVASAMMYLSGKGYVHCDLATRNILLSMDGVCKVTS